MGLAFKWFVADLGSGVIFERVEALPKFSETLREDFTQTSYQIWRPPCKVQPWEA